MDRHVPMCTHPFLSSMLQKKKPPQFFLEMQKSYWQVLIPSVILLISSIGSKQVAIALCCLYFSPTHTAQEEQLLSF